MSVSMLVGSLTYWSEANFVITPDLDDISFWNFLRHLLEVSTLVTISFKKCCMSSQNKATQGEAVFVGGRGGPFVGGWVCLWVATTSTSY